MHHANNSRRGHLKVLHHIFGDLSRIAIQPPKSPSSKSPDTLNSATLLNHFALFTVAFQVAGVVAIVTCLRYPRIRDEKLAASDGEILWDEFFQRDLGFEDV